MQLHSNWAIVNTIRVIDTIGANSFEYNRNENEIRQIDIVRHFIPISFLFAGNSPFDCLLSFDSLTVTILGPP